MRLIRLKSMRIATIVILTVSCSAFVVVVLIVWVYFYCCRWRSTGRTTGYRHVRQVSTTVVNFDDILPPSSLCSLDKQDPCSICFDR